MAVWGRAGSWRRVLSKVVATVGAVLVLWGVLEMGPKSAPSAGWPRGWAAALLGLLAMTVGGPAAAPTRAARTREALVIVFVALLSFVLLFVRTNFRSGG